MSSPSNLLEVKQSRRCFVRYQGTHLALLRGRTAHIWYMWLDLPILPRPLPYQGATNYTQSATTLYMGHMAHLFVYDVLPLPAPFAPGRGQPRSAESKFGGGALPPWLQAYDVIR